MIDSAKSALCPFSAENALLLHEHEKTAHGNDFSKDYGFKDGSYYCKHPNCHQNLHNRWWAARQQLPGHYDLMKMLKFR